MSTATLPAARTDQPDRPDLWRLVERAQAGDAGAFGELYDATNAKIFRYVYWRTHDRITAQDLTQAVYLKALRSIGQCQRRADSPTAWLVTIARTGLLDHVRAEGRRRECLAPDIFDDSLADVGLLEPGADECVLDHADRVFLWRTVLDTLNEEQVEVCRLRFLVGLNVEETAAAMGKAAPAVKSMQHRAIRQLRKRLAGTQVDPAGLVDAVWPAAPTSGDDVAGD